MTGSMWPEAELSYGRKKSEKADQERNGGSPAYGDACLFRTSRRLQDRCFGDSSGNEKQCGDTFTGGTREETDVSETTAEVTTEAETTEPETTVPETTEAVFTDVDETVYATDTVNIRAAADKASEGLGKLRAVRLSGGPGLVRSGAGWIITGGTVISPRNI